MNYPVPSLPYPLRGVRRTPPAPPSVELLPTLHRLGVRVASIAHWGRTPLADGSGEDATGGRLTHAGVAAVREMERLGMIWRGAEDRAQGHLGVRDRGARPSEARRTATSPPGPAAPPWTGWARSAAARTPTTSMWSWPSCRAVRGCWRAWSRRCADERP
ncbi:membrane dipeptidase [Microbispora bryophytorum]|uniref:membrane dipeptidase n=1 Tax=Microbispora bryophytorum TaxID=1460882 RepID=UPI0033D0434B